jgi:hypothetical protein
MTTEIDGHEFQWHGGEYIEIGYTATEDSTIRNNEGVPSHEAGDFVAGDVINVWDHAKGEATISGFDEFQATCESYLQRENDLPLENQGEIEGSRMIPGDESGDGF